MIRFEDIQPVAIKLFEGEWVNWCNEADVYFKSIGIENVYWINGVHAEKFGVKASRPYLRDNPEQNWYLEQRTVGGYLSGYLTFELCRSHTEWKYILFLEEDAIFIDGWKEIFLQALKDVPEDFDFLFLGSCCTEGRESIHIKGNVYHVKYPMCGHAYLIAQKAFPLLVENCRDACIPFDVHLFDGLFDKLKVYTILPRLANQHDTELPI